MRTSGKKLVRRSTPKLRSGCLTCKERRIKCDETKPICLRCSRSNRSCQGYSDPLQYHPTVDVSTLATWSLPFHGSFADPILCSAKEPLTEDEISQDKQSFHHFVTEASIRIPSVLDLGVWTEIIPMLGTSFPAIRYALLALSAQHEMTIRSSYDTNNNKASVHALRLYSYRQYDKAIQRLNMILVDAAQKYDILLETSFACLLLVVCEILRGSDVAAQYHLDGAINLISIPSVAKSQLLLAEYRCASFPIGSGLLKGLGLIFQQLDIQAAAFSGSRPPIGPENVDSITNSLTPSFSNNSINGCSTIEELRQNLLSIQVKISRFISSETALNRKYVPDLKRSKDQKDQYNSIKKEQETLVRRLERWKSIFDTVSLESNDMMLDTVTIRNSLPKVWPNFHKQRAQIVMLLSYLTYYILLSTSLSPDETAYDSHTSIFAHITDLSEMILQLEPGSFSSNNGAEPFSHSSFCIDMKLIYPLYITALKCRDFIIRHRAVRLLSMCDREGVWDGRMMASMAQTVISCEEELAITTGLEYGQGVFPTADYFVDDCIISIPERARIHGVGIVEMDRQKRQLRIICSRKDETTTVDNDVIWRTTLLDVNF